MKPSVQSLASEGIEFHADAYYCLNEGLSQQSYRIGSISGNQSLDCLPAIRPSGTAHRSALTVVVPIAA